MTRSSRLGSCGGVAFASRFFASRFERSELNQGLHGFRNVFAPEADSDSGKAFAIYVTLGKYE